MASLAPASLFLAYSLLPAAIRAGSGQQAGSGPAPCPHLSQLTLHRGTGPDSPPVQALSPCSLREMDTRGPHAQGGLRVMGVTPPAFEPMRNPPSHSLRQGSAFVACSPAQGHAHTPCLPVRLIAASRKQALVSILKALPSPTLPSSHESPTQQHLTKELSAGPLPTTFPFTLNLGEKRSNIFFTDTCYQIKEVLSIPNLSGWFFPWL